MTSKYILNSSNLSSNQVKFFEKINSLSPSNRIRLIDSNIDSIYAIDENADLLVPVLFEKDLQGNFHLNGYFIKDELMHLNELPFINLIFLIVYDDSPLTFKEIYKFQNDELIIDHKSNIETFNNCALTQSSMLESFSNKPLSKDGIKQFFELFNIIEHSGNIPNNDYYILEKLDHINQEISSIRNIPFFLRSNSIPYRLIMPGIKSINFLKVKTVNLKNKIKTKIKSFKSNFTRPERSITTIESNEILDRFFAIAKSTVNPSKITLPVSQNPTLSIIIPVYGKLDFLARCLHSIQIAKTNIDFEVIVVDDCGPEKVISKFKEKLNGIRIHQNEKNSGFTNTCNQGAKIANGAYLCFLNSDTIVTDYWCDSLLNGFLLAENVGIVGPRLLYENGTLQESGGIVFSNADAANIGRNESINNSWFKYFKDVDYVSGAALTILKDDFDEVGGFDSKFTPAYYEDTSLCLDVRHKLKKRVVVNPLSSVIHHEGATNGTDESSGFKKFQNINKTKFFDKHKNDLVDYGESYQNLWWDRDKYIRGNVLIIDQCIPTPNEDSGSKDMDNILRGLLDLNFRPHVFALSNRGETPEAYGYYEKGVHCIFGKDNLSFKDFIKEYSSLFSLIIVSRVNSYSEVEKLLKEHAPDTKKIFYTVDLHHVRLESEYNQTKDMAALVESRKLMAEELQAISETDKTIVLSQKEKDYLVASHGIDANKLSIWPLIRSEFENMKDYKKSTKPKDIIFIGGYRHTPNIDAVKILEKEILPIAKNIFLKNGVAFPAIKLYGSNPTSYIESLDSDLIKYMGFVEKEEDAFKNARISIAPLPFGSGLKGKTLSSLIYKTPIVGSSFAFEGFEIKHGNILKLSSMKPEEFAQNIYDTYVKAESIKKNEWDDLFKKLESKFSYTSFKKKLSEDIIQIKK